MSAFVSWTSKHPPEKVYLVQWDHIEAERDGKKDIRRLHVWCDAESLQGELGHLERRKMKYSVTEYSKNNEQSASAINEASNGGE